MNVIIITAEHSYGDKKFRAYEKNESLILFFPLPFSSSFFSPRRKFQSEFSRFSGFFHARLIYANIPESFNFDPYNTYHCYVLLDA